jgi:hypothetical protein
MKSKITLLGIKLIIFLVIWLFTHKLSAQQKPGAIEGYWHAPGYQLYLQGGFFLLQQQTTSFSGAYHQEGKSLKLYKAESEHIYSVVNRDGTLWLLGAEMEVKLQADKVYPSRNVFLGTISQIEKENIRETASSQLPEEYHN